jgi:hypothetical protein
MKIHRIILLLLGCSLFAPSCKKGKDDPTFSFLTRKQRLTGNWEMTMGGASFTYYEPDKPVINDYFKFDNGALTLNETETFGPPTIYTGRYSLILSFKKDGTFLFTETITGIGKESLTATGTWNFTSGVGKYKNKECVTMKISNVSGDGVNNHFFNCEDSEFTYKLTELRNKEIKIEASGTHYYTGTEQRISYQTSYTFKSK